MSLAQARGVSTWDLEFPRLRRIPEQTIKTQVRNSSANITGPQNTIIVNGVRYLKIEDDEYEYDSRDHESPESSATEKFPELPPRWNLPNDFQQCRERAESEMIDSLKKRAALQDLRASLGQDSSTLPPFPTRQPPQMYNLKPDGIGRAVPQNGAAEKVRKDDAFGSETATVFVLESDQYVKYVVHLNVLEVLFSEDSDAIRQARQNGRVFLNFELPGFNPLLRYLYREKLAFDYWGGAFSNDEIVNSSLDASYLGLESVQARLLEMYRVDPKSSVELLHHAMVVYNSSELNSNFRVFFKKNIVSALHSTVSRGGWTYKPALNSAEHTQLYEHIHGILKEDSVLARDIKEAMVDNLILSPDQHHQYSQTHDPEEEENLEDRRDKNNDGFVDDVEGTPTVTPKCCSFGHELNNRFDECTLPSNTKPLSWNNMAVPARDDNAIAESKVSEKCVPNGINVDDGWLATSLDTSYQQCGWGDCNSENCKRRQSFDAHKAAWGPSPPAPTPFTLQSYGISQW